MTMFCAQRDVDNVGNVDKSCCRNLVMLLVCAFLGLFFLAMGCNSISGTCSDGNVWLHVTSGTEKKLHDCQFVSIGWQAGNASGDAEMEMLSNSNSDEIVFLISTQGDEEFENDIPIGMSPVDVIVSCNAKVWVDDMVFIEWETTYCDGDDVTNGKIYLSLDDF